MSKFSAALKARRDEPVESEKSITEMVQESVTEQKLAVSPRKLGRPAGKRSNSDMIQVTAYVPADLYDRVRIRIIQERRRPKAKKRDFSDLLAEWMEGWMASS